MTMKKWYEFKQSCGDDDKKKNELLIYGDITSIAWNESDVGAFDFAKELAEVEGDLTVRINSYGGEVAEGLAMYSLLKEFKGEVTTVCDGFACSAASVVFMAGDNRLMRNSGLLLIHNAWTIAQGDSNALAKAAEDLEKITSPSVEIYKEVTGLPEDQIKDMMDVETWITASEALEMGFATEIIKDEAKQSLQDSYLNHAIMNNKELSAQLFELQSQLNKVLEEFSYYKTAHEEAPVDKKSWEFFYSNKKSN